MPMKKPSESYPVSSRSVPSPMPNIILDPSIKGKSYDQLIENRGIRFVHQKAIPCPNMKSLDANNHHPNCDICDGNNFYYYDDREIWGIFYSNSLEKMYEAQGVWETGNAVVTFPAVYPDGIEADFNTFDRLFVPDFEVRLWQLIEYRPSSDDKQPLRYPITAQGVHIMTSADSAGNLKMYTEGTDFNIDAGSIEWIIKPNYDEDNDRGEVISIAYYANPVYNVVQLLHEMRVTQQLNSAKEKIAIRLPQQVVVKRDFLFNKPEQQNP